MKVPFFVLAFVFLGVSVNVAHAMRKSLASDVKAVGRARMPVQIDAKETTAHGAQAVTSAIKFTPGREISEEWQAVGSGINSTPGDEFSEELHGVSSSTDFSPGREISEESQSLASGVNSTPERDFSEGSRVDGSQGHRVTATWNRSVLLEQSSFFLHKVKSFDNYAVSLLFSLAAILTICCLSAIVAQMCCFSVIVALLRRKGDSEESEGEGLGLDSDASRTGSKHGVEVEVKMDELVRRLSKTVRKLPVGKISFLAGSHTGTGMKERHLGIWWGTKSHTWGSTRLGWWESIKDHKERSQPLNSIYLNSVSEVRLTDDEDNYPDPGICIAYGGQQGQTDHLFLFFSTDDIAFDYAKDLRMMIEKVKKADAAEKSSKS